LLDITTRELHPATPEFFNRVSLPLDYNPDAPIPRKWLRFMLQAMARRKPLVRLAQELIGYLISDDTSQQTVIHFWGPPRTGKGTTMRVTTALVGPLNCCNPSIQTLAGRFGLQGCLGKSLIKITDMDCDDKQALGLAATRINAISGEDDVAVERKMLTDWNGRLHGRLMLASNGLPDFGSHTTALAARLVILPFEVSSLGREDRELTDKLLTELPGILNWALDGLARMRARGRFVEPPESVEAKFRMMYASEPVRGLVEENLYAVYKRYCRVTGTYPLALHKFSERMSNLFPSVAPSRRRAGDNRVQVFAGIRLNDAEVCQAYKIDPEMIGLGFDGPDALLLDADGWPVPRFDGDDMVLIGE
jgi:putative DNA primase/helicase